MPVVNSIRVQEDRTSKLKDFRRLVEATKGWDEDTDVDIVLGSLVGDDGEAVGPCFTFTVRRDEEEAKTSKPTWPTPRTPQVQPPSVVQPLPPLVPRVNPVPDRWVTFNEQTGRGPANPDEPLSFTAGALAVSASTTSEEVVAALADRLLNGPDKSS